MKIKTKILGEFKKHAYFALTHAIYMLRFYIFNDAIKAIIEFRFLKCFFSINAFIVKL